MIANILNVQPCWSALTRPILVISILVATIPALAQNSKSFGHDNFFQPGNLVVSRSVYDNLASNVTVGEPLPPNCVPRPVVVVVWQGLTGCTRLFLTTT